jgi:hypothetical protein
MLSKRSFLATATVLLGVILLALLARASNGGAAAGDTERVSVDSNGVEADGGDTEDPSITPDGRYVVFFSAADNLVTGDTNTSQDTFVHDRQTGVTERVSVDSNGGEVDSHAGGNTISDDGRYVAFQTRANGLAPGDTQSDGDTFVHDRQTGDTEIVSVDSSGNHGDGESVSLPVISGDGRYVTFTSTSTNLVADDLNGEYDVFVHDRQTGMTERVSVDSNGAEGDSSAFVSSISSDGRYVIFDTRSQLVPNDSEDYTDVYLHDRQTGDTERVSLTSNEEQGGDDSFYGHITDDGRYVVFESRATNLAPGGDTNGDVEDIFVRDRQTGTTELVSIDSDGDQGSDESARSGISSDGRYIVFGTASSLVPEDTGSFNDVYRHDRMTGITQRASVSSSAVAGNNDSWSSESDANITADGRYIAFGSDASNLVPGDTEGFRDAFVHELGDPATPTPTPTPTPTLSPTPTSSPTPTLSPSATATSTSTPTTTPSSSPSETPAPLIQGDINCDGQVDENDALLAIMFASGVFNGVLPDCQHDLGENAGGGIGIWGDVNCDGVVDVLDALAILIHTSGADPTPAPSGCTPIGQPLGG